MIWPCYCDTCWWWLLKVFSQLHSYSTDDNDDGHNDMNDDNKVDIDEDNVDQIEWQIDRGPLISRQSKGSCLWEQTRERERWRTVQWGGLVTVQGPNVCSEFWRRMHYTWPFRCLCIKVEHICPWESNIAQMKFLWPKLFFSFTHFQPKLQIEMQCLPTANVGSDPKS